MEIDPGIASTLGFPRLKYTAVERERRWLCRDVPRELVVRTEAITDLYVTGSRLRLREARPTDGGPAMLRLTRKADADPRTRLITSIYLPEDEFALLARLLPGVRIAKLRHRLKGPSGVALAVDEFQGGLAGLLVAEAEFETDDSMAGFPIPGFALREISDDPRFTCAQLALHGLPADHLPG